MANVHIRNLPDAVHRALRVRAAQHGRSTEAEIRAILETATRPPQRVRLGSLFASIAREAGGLTDDEAESINRLRDNTPVEPMILE
jgi:plasmid stability protein